MATRKGKIVTRSELSNILGVSDTTIGNWQKLDGFPIESGGGKGNIVQYNTADVINWRRAEDKVESTGDGGDELKRLNLVKRNDLLDEKIKEAKLANEALVGGLYPADVVEELWIARITAFTKALDSLSASLAFKLGILKTQEERTQALEEAFDTLLRELSKKMRYSYDLAPWKQLLKETKEDIDELNDTQ